MRSRLDEIKARAEAATNGPWVNDSTEIGRPFPGTDTIDVWVAESCQPDGDGIDGEADAEFIAHARADVPALVAALETVLERHKPTLWAAGAGPGKPVCQTCELAYPCPDVETINAALGDPDV